MLNTIWVSFFLLAITAALFGGWLGGAGGMPAEVMQAGFANAKLGFEIALGLTGVMCLWMGLMRVGERAGAVEWLARVLAPLLRRLFPGVPAGHSALGAMTMNLSANALGLDNAATPMGLQAMRELQSLNPSSDTASNAQILFLVLNASSVTLLPITIFTYRAQLGAADPTDVFLPILFATACSTLAGLIFVAAAQRLSLWNLVVMSWLAGGALILGAAVAWFLSLPAAEMTAMSALTSNTLLLGLIALFLLLASLRRINAYESFVEGAREGFQTAVSIIPYLVAMLVAIGMLRASGLLGAAVDGLRGLVVAGGWNAEWVEAVPTMLMKPLSGSGARAMMIETMQAQGVDSFAGRLACVVQGSTETTFYVLAVYLGAVGIKRARHALAACLVADAAGFTGAVVAAYAFFA